MDIDHGTSDTESVISSQKRNLIRLWKDSIQRTEDELKNIRDMQSEHLAHRDRDKYPDLTTWYETQIRELEVELVRFRVLLEKAESKLTQSDPRRSPQPVETPSDPMDLHSQANLWRTIYRLTNAVSILHSRRSPAGRFP